MTSTVVVTPTPSQRLRRSRPLIVIGLIVLISAMLFILIPPNDYDDVPLSPQNPGPRGAQALARVVEDLGVEVLYAPTASEALLEAKQPNTTLVVANPDLLASEIDEAIAELPRVVGIGGTPMGDSDLFPSIGDEYAYNADETETPAAIPVDKGSCQSPSARAAQQVSAGDHFLIDQSFQDDFDTDAAEDSTPASGSAKSSEWQWCFLMDDAGQPMPASSVTAQDQGAVPSYDTPGGALYVEKREGDTYRALVLDASLASNQSIAQHGNATLMLNVLTAPAPRDDLGRIVWYNASLQDTLRPQVPGAPSWLNAVILLLGGAAVFLAFARGRRLGRLVPEDLPSYVPVAETIIGRGRLLRRQGQRAHAAHHLRVATARRLAARLGVPEGEDPEMLRSALRGAGVSDTDSQWLWSPEPATDDDLVEVASRLAAIEEEIRNVRH